MWYSKFDLIQRKGQIECPNCKHIYEEQIFYTLEELPYKKCENPSLFIRTKSFIYVFDLKRAPSLFLRMIKELQSKSMKDSYSQLLEVIKVFSSETIDQNV